MATEKQITANRENAQLSSGPVTPEGKAASSHNAVKTGLTGQTVLLKTDNVEAYKKHIQRFQDKFEPFNDDEHALVQDLADTEWRLLRITPLEANILALGRLELAPLFAAETDESVREGLLEAKVFLVYRKDLNNLSLQETRLRRHRVTITNELTEMQTKRKESNRRNSRRAAECFLTAITDDGWEEFDHSHFGFDFTLDQMFDAVAEIRCQRNKYLFPEVTKFHEREVAEQQFSDKWGIIEVE